MIRTLSPYLYVEGAAEALDWYTAHLDARVRVRLDDPSSGRVGHAELELPDGTVLMVSDAYPEAGFADPRRVGGSPVALQVVVDDCHATVERLAGAGAAIIVPARDEFFGLRMANLEDPWGHRWVVTQVFEEVSPEEMQRRWDAMGEHGASG